MGITGLILTKLDGTGVGEKIDDLREFHATEFVDALLDKIPD